MSKFDYYNENVLSEKDFYPPADNRTLQSLIRDIDKYNNFVECSKYIFDLYEREDCYEN